MGFFKKMKMKENYDLLILSTFLRIEKDNKDSSGYVHKKIDGLNIVLCMYENGNTVSINREKVDELLKSIDSSNYRYSLDRLFDTAALSTLSEISDRFIQLHPEAIEIPIDKNKNSNLLLFTEIENPTPAALIYAKPYFINGNVTQIEKFVPNLNCPKISKDFKGKTIFALPKPNLIFFGDSNIRTIKEEMIEHMKKFVYDDLLLSNRFYMYDDNFDIISVGEFRLN